jgi:hypothetical protein
LLKSEYQFVEFCDEEDRNSLTYAIPESGCYRVLKEKRAGNSCHVDIDNKLNKKSVEPYVSFIKDHCIAVTKIEKPEAPAKFSIKEAPFDKTKDTFFMRFEFIIEDGNDVLSKQVDYTYYTSNERLPSYSCRHVIDGFKRYSIDEFTHKTINSNNFGDLK